MKIAIVKLSALGDIVHAMVVLQFMRLHNHKIKIDWINYNKANFVCCLTLYWPNGENFSGEGIIKGKILSEKKGTSGFGYDPIFIPSVALRWFEEIGQLTFDV